MTTVQTQEIKVKLPDGTVKAYPGPVTAAQVAADIGAGLAKAAIGAKVDGELRDLNRPIERDCELAIITRPKVGKDGCSQFRDAQHAKDALYLLRHSCAHVMAEAIERLWPDTQLAYGPPLENGFYYDIRLDTPISSDDFPRIEDEMRKIVGEDRPFTRYDLSIQTGFDVLKQRGNRYKIENANQAVQNGATTLSWYVTGEPYYTIVEDRKYWLLAGQFPVPATQQIGSLIPGTHYITPLQMFQSGAPSAGYSRQRDWPEFEDLCAGPHVPRTGHIGAFKVMSIAASHFRGDVTDDPFQRVYGTAFFTQADLDKHLALLEEARQRDHRVVGQRLGLFAIDDKVGQGLILWKPHGAVIRDELQKFIMKHLVRQGYSQVFTPHIGRLELYKTSGHFPYYADSQFPPLIDHEQLKALADEGCTCSQLSNMMKDGQIDGYLLKPMNCPHHIRIYASEKRSYRDLPIRLAEFGTVYRWEQSGELNGMTRVRGFTQDDAHLFVTEDQLHAEVAGCLELVKIVLGTLEMNDYRVRVGLRDPASDKYVGEPEQWNKAEAACRIAAESLGVPFTAEPGEAAFYGPKIDFVVKDVIGREWQLGTVQVDYQLPQRFDLEYVGADNRTHRPVMIHRAPFGSMERFIGVLIEHFNGRFPLWLSPEQVRVLPIKPDFTDYARKVEAALKDVGLRASVDNSGDHIKAQIKNAQEAQVPYMLVVGGRDAEANAVSVRERSKGDLGAMPLTAFVEQAAREVATHGQEAVRV